MLFPDLDAWGDCAYADPSVMQTPFEPPPAPGHVLSTDQRYTEELHTTAPAGYAQPHWPAAAGECYVLSAQQTGQLHSPVRANMQQSTTYGLQHDLL